MCLTSQFLRKLITSMLSMSIVGATCEKYRQYQGNPSQYLTDCSYGKSDIVQRRFWGPLDSANDHDEVSQRCYFDVNAGTQSENDSGFIDQLGLDARPCFFVRNSMNSHQWMVEKQARNRADEYTSPGVKKSVIPLEHDETKQRRVANQTGAVLKTLP